MTATRHEKHDIPDDAAHWDSGDWIDWHRRTGGLHEVHASTAAEPEARMRSTYRALLQSARLYHQVTGRHLAIYDDIAELHAILHCNHRPRKETDTGVLIKCLSPKDGKDSFTVDLGQPFTQLLVVRIDAEFTVDARMMPRDRLPGAKARPHKMHWRDLPIPD